MSISINVLIITIVVLVCITFFLIIRVMIHKLSAMEELFINNNSTYNQLRAGKLFKENELIEIKKLKSRSKIRRKEAATSLGIIGSDNARLALEKALLSEQDYSVKIYISNALTDIRSEQSLRSMISALIGTHKWYRDKAISNILEFGVAFHPHFLDMKSSRDLECMELLIKYSSNNVNNDTKAYLFDFINYFDRLFIEVESNYKERHNKNLTSYKLEYLSQDMNDLLEMVCQTLSHYYLEFDDEIYCTSNNPIIRRYSYWAISKRNSSKHLRVLISHLSEEQYEETLISAALRMLEANPKFIFLIEEAFFAEKDAQIKSRLVQILSNRIEYYILLLGTKQGLKAKEIIELLIRNRRIDEMIGFLNLNKDKEIERYLIDIIKENVHPDNQIGEELRTYLNDMVLKEWGVSRYIENRSDHIHEKDKKLIWAVSLFIFLGFFFIPILFLFRHWDSLTIWPIIELLERYVIEFNYGVAYYCIMVNLSYIVLLMLSYGNLKEQAILWNLKNVSMLFRSKMIPTVSIIVPAYNEEKIIVSSVKSLLNLKYPDYELIVVNDGSKDDTLSHLIEAFKLNRTYYWYKTNINTAPIRGIYRNPSIPKLIVIDKSKGGKADALNTGINVAKKEYFCGIDSDSLLEPEALLRLASLTLDESKETPALGGNVLPINGCKIDNGLVAEIHIPKNILARLQNLEYLRAFMIGRLGWQKINSLLIISGAFGLFRKERIIGIGGYLTKFGQYRRDTVSEDMELVVRIIRMLHDMKVRFKILYAYNANCWTQVPEDVMSLKNQRFRWNRGLIDIMYYHKRLILNPKYKMTGMLAMPYYLIFEAFGPMIETQGYVMVVFAAALGLLDGQIALLLFIGMILLGIINSISSLLIAEREEQYFSLKDTAMLLLYAFIENFGPRQWLSLWRVQGLFNVIFGNGGWGKIKRKEI